MGIEADFRFEDRRREKESFRRNDEARLAHGEVKASDLREANGFFSVLDRSKARLVVRRARIRIDD
jgi:hypothetical protein